MHQADSDKKQEQDLTPKWQRRVKEELQNQTVSFVNANKFYDGKFQVCDAGSFWAYNCDVDDFGWGCAWRAIQTLLSCQKRQNDFAQLFERYSKKQDLMAIAKPLFSQEVLKILEERKWAPADLEHLWAQPFIASLICSHLHIPYRLLLVNGCPQHHYAPAQVFTETICFHGLICLVKQKIGHTSYMIDNGFQALSIIGYSEPDAVSVELLFADPHIRSNRNSKEVGLYRKTFDLEGKGLADDQTPAQREEGLYKVYEKVHFDWQKWMVCYAEKK